MSNYKLLIFDWDGTLMDSAARIVSSMQNAATELQLPIPDEQSIRNIIGLSLGIAIDQIVPNISAADNKRLCAGYSDHYREFDQTPTPLYKGVEESMFRLKDKGYTLAVATGKSRKGLDRALANTGFDKIVTVSRGADETKSKPDPLMLEEILHATQFSASQALMIGDTSYDLEMAQNLNMPSIGVSYGMHSIDVLKQYKPVFIADKFQSIEQWLDANGESK